MRGGRVIYEFGAGIGIGRDWGLGSGVWGLRFRVFVLSSLNVIKLVQNDEFEFLDFGNSKIFLLTF